MWAKPATRAQTVALIDVESGQSLFSMALPADVDVSRGSITRQVGGSLLGIGPLIVDTDVKRLKVVLNQYKIVSLASGHVWAKHTASKGTVDIRTSDGQFQVSPLPDGADVPFGAVTGGVQGATTAALALVTTSTPDGLLLQALPAT